MKKEFDDLGQLFAYLQKQVDNVLNDEVATTAKKVHRQVIKENVYDWQPEIYERRGANGGLFDLNNFKALVQDGEAIFQNNTLFNERYGSANRGFLAALIDGGDGTGGYYYDYPATKHNFKKPRRIFEPTAEKMNQNGLAADMLKFGLNRHGIDAE